MASQEDCDAEKAKKRKPKQQQQQQQQQQQSSVLPPATPTAPVEPNELAQEAMVTENKGNSEASEVVEIESMATKDEKASKDEEATKDEEAANDEKAAKDEEAANDEKAAKDEEAAKDELAAKDEAAAKEDLQAKEDVTAKDDAINEGDSETTKETTESQLGLSALYNPMVATDPPSAALICFPWLSKLWENMQPSMMPRDQLPRHRPSTRMVTSHHLLQDTEDGKSKASKRDRGSNMFSDVLVRSTSSGSAPDLVLQDAGDSKSKAVKRDRGSNMASDLLARLTSKGGVSDPMSIPEEEDLSEAVQVPQPSKRPPPRYAMSTENSGHKRGAGGSTARSSSRSSGGDSNRPAYMSASQNVGGISHRAMGGVSQRSGSSSHRPGNVSHRSGGVSHRSSNLPSNRPTSGGASVRVGTSVASSRTTARKSGVTEAGGGKRVGVNATNGPISHRAAGGRATARKDEVADDGGRSSRRGRGPAPGNDIDVSDGVQASNTTIRDRGVSGSRGAGSGRASSSRVSSRVSSSRGNDGGRLGYSKYGYSSLESSPASLGISRLPSAKYSEGDGSATRSGRTLSPSPPRFYSSMTGRMLDFAGMMAEREEEARVVTKAREDAKNAKLNQEERIAAAKAQALIEAEARREANKLARAKRVELECRALVMGLVEDVVEETDAAMRSRWFHLTFSHISANNVPRADKGHGQSNDLSDPYVLFEVISNDFDDTPYPTARTKPIEGVLQPKWTDAVALTIPAGSTAAMTRRPRIRISVFDKDISVEDELLGTAEVDIDQDEGAFLDLTMTGAGNFANFTLSFEFSFNQFFPLPSALLRLTRIEAFGLVPRKKNVAKRPGSASPEPHDDASASPKKQRPSLSANGGRPGLYLSFAPVGLGKSQPVRTPSLGQCSQHVAARQMQRLARGRLVRNSPELLKMRHAAQQAMRAERGEAPLNAKRGSAKKVSNADGNKRRKKKSALHQGAKFDDLSNTTSWQDEGRPLALVLDLPEGMPRPPELYVQLWDELSDPEGNKPVDGSATLLAQSEIPLGEGGSGLVDLKLQGLATEVRIRFRFEMKTEGFEWGEDVRFEELPSAEEDESEEPETEQENDNEQEMDSKNEQVKEQVLAQVHEQVHEQVSEQVREQVSAQVSEQGNAQQEKVQGQAREANEGLENEQPQTGVAESSPLKKRLILQMARMVLK